jgi:hypothetical protein
MTDSSHLTVLIEYADGSRRVLDVPKCPEADAPGFAARMAYDRTTPIRRIGMVGDGSTVWHYEPDWTADTTETFHPGSGLPDPGLASVGRRALG